MAEIEVLELWNNIIDDEQKQLRRAGGVLGEFVDLALQAADRPDDEGADHGQDSESGKKSCG